MLPVFLYTWNPLESKASFHLSSCPVICPVPRWIVIPKFWRTPRANWSRPCCSNTAALECHLELAVTDMQTTKSMEARVHFLYALEGAGQLSGEHVTPKCLHIRVPSRSTLFHGNSHKRWELGPSTEVSFQVISHTAVGYLQV